MKIIAIILTILAVLSIPICLYGGTIQTNIVCRTTVEMSGKIKMDIEISNTGDVPAYNVEATIFIADWVQKYDDLGKNPPGGKIYLSSHYFNSDLKPGKYIATIRITFEESSGKFHRAYHFSGISYQMDKLKFYTPPLFLHLNSPLVNKKALWNQSNIRLSMKNNYKGSIKPRFYLYLPDDFSTSEPNRHYELFQGKEKTETIRLTVNQPKKQEYTYHLITWYELDGIHYSHNIKEKIRVEEKPVYFKWYLIIGITVFLISFGVVYCYSRKNGKRSQALHMHVFRATNIATLYS